ncbi:MAG TPA: type II toxin-antitoxin system prevent-host-death family antitoxin [Candidatus Acidoferrales bacterium]|nr:type II toxin-antitoxin system prevent-host-death family antitoxin [Candidatus Acidoferrales bacterium]
MERVGIRELRQNLRQYLHRVAEGAAFEVTEFGRPVARLGPLPAGGSRFSALVADGRVTPARAGAAGLPAPVRLPRGASATESLLAERRDDQR